MLRVLFIVLVAAVVLYLIMLVLIGGIATLLGAKNRLYDREVQKELERRKRFFGKKKQ